MCQNSLKITLHDIYAKLWPNKTKDQKPLLTGALPRTPNSYMTLHCCNIMVKAYVFVDIFTPKYYEKHSMIKSDLFSRSNISQGVPLKSIYCDISGKSKFFSTGIISSFFLESFRLRQEKWL